MALNLIWFFLWFPFTICTTNRSLQLSELRYSLVSKDVTDLFNVPISISTQIKSVSKECQTDYDNFFRALNNHELWALKMLDASAKMPSGILSGNVNQFGDYEECLSVPQAQYCLTEFNLNSLPFKLYSQHQNLIHSHFAFTGSFNDPRHRVPNFSTVKWGMCFPAKCSPRDLQKSISATFGVQVQVRSSMCRKSMEPPRIWSLGDYLAWFMFGSILLLVITSTIGHPLKHFCNQKSKIIQILFTFSLQKNWRQITKGVLSHDENINTINNNNNNKKVKTPISKDENIQSVDGIRTLSAISLLMCHKGIALLYNPYINRTKTIENFSLPWTIIAKTAIIYTDSFILLSGFLTARSFISDLKKYNRINFKEKLLNRIFRITPNIMAVILFCTYILPELNSGPLWPDVVVHHSNLCKQHMWRNLFYIHNHFGFENMCLTHTHQVGIDMQLFLFSPLLIYLWWINSKIGITVAVSLATLSTILRYWVTYSKKLSHVIYFGISINNMFATANLSYILPSHRATIYIMGIALAFFLEKHRLSLNKFYIGALWILAFSCGLLAVFGPSHMARLDHIYNPTNASIFAAFSPILWGLMLCWIIYASNFDYAGFFGDFLSWRGFKLFSKIAYSFYLVQFPIIFYFIGIQKNPDEFKPHVLLDFSETTLVIIFSFILTLFIEMPFNSLKNIFLNNKIQK